MKYVPMPHQKAAIEFALNNRCCGEFARMGTGKTSIVLTVIEHLMYEMLKIKRVLLIAPINVCELTWPDEIEKWDHTRHLSYEFAHGKDKNLTIQFAKETDIMAVNFEGIQWLANSWGKIPRFDMVVVDESTWIKNHAAIRTKTLFDMVRFIPRRIILTGSPAPNGLMDLWAQMFILDRGVRLLPYITHYRNEYFDKDTYVKFKYNIKNDSRKRIISKISDIVTVVEDKDIKGMPKVVTNIIKIKLPKKVHKIYKEVQNEFFSELDCGHQISTDNPSAKNQKMRQILSGFVYKDDYSVVKIHTDRCRVLKELIQSINGNVLVAINFTEEVNLIRGYFKKDIPFINRLSKKKEDVTTIRKWQKGELPILLAHPSSIAYGLNLQSGGYNIIWFSQTWSLDIFEQYLARLARKGQLSSSVFNHILVAIGTIDEAIAMAITDKDATQRSVMAGIKTWRKQNGFK